MLSAYKDTDCFMKAIDIDIERFLATLRRLILKIRLIREADENVTLLQQYQLVVDASSVVSKTDVNGFITLLKNKGIKIAIDDFGSGYSNYERLLSYRPDILKIDGSLIKNLDEN